MNCLKPIMLKSGQLVPCGKCVNCQSAVRTEKSVLVQLHCDAFDRMPLFIGFSYNDENLPLHCTCPVEDRFDGAQRFSEPRFYRKADMNELNLSLRDDPSAPSYTSHCLVPSLFRKDISQFMKFYKRSCNLLNDQFTYFGCGEYGQDAEYTNRPHYHFIWFGDKNLERLYETSVHAAERWLAEFWQKGNVDINVAEWSGIHYVTKYCLKDINRVPDGAYPSFTIAGKGIGLPWLRSHQAEKIRQQLLYCQFNKEKIFQEIDLSVLDWKDHQHCAEQLKEYIDYLKPSMPDFTCILPSGKKAALPRKLRRILLGSYQHFKDNPIWLYQTLNEWYETECAFVHYAGLDKDYGQYSRELREQYALKIQQRINRNKFKVK